MTTFNNLILTGFGLRILFVIIGTFYSFKIIGLKNIQFLSTYFKTHFLSFQKLFYWSIALFSIIYFEHLVSNAQGVSLNEVYKKNGFLTILVALLLIGIIVYAFFDAKESIQNAKETKKELKTAKNLKTITKVISIASWFAPGGHIVKVGIFAISIWGNRKIDRTIEAKVSMQVIKTIEAMLIIASINLSIILISTYLITGKIIFW